MRLILALLVLISLSSYGQSKKFQKIKQDEILANSIERYLGYISASDFKSIDSLFIEFPDTLNFNLSGRIYGKGFVVLSFDELLSRFKDKTQSKYLRVIPRVIGNNIEISMHEILVQYSDKEIVAIQNSEKYKVTYLKGKYSLFRFKKIEKSDTGCRYFDRVTNDGHKSRESVCF